YGSQGSLDCELLPYTTLFRSGWFQRQIAASARRQQDEVEAGARVVVGVNRYREGSEEAQIDLLKIDPAVEEKQRARMARLRAERDRKSTRLNSSHVKISYAVF